MWKEELLRGAAVMLWFCIVTLMLAVLMGVFGCAPWNGIEVDEDIYKIHDQDKAMLLTEVRVNDHYGVSLPHHDDIGADVKWTSTVCPYHMDRYAVVLDNVCYNGIMWSCDQIYVALSNRDPERTCGSALLHEYGHCLLFTLGWEDSAAVFCSYNRLAEEHDTAMAEFNVVMDDKSWVGDRDHTNAEFWGVIVDVGKEACERGW